MSTGILNLTDWWSLFNSSLQSCFQHLFWQPDPCCPLKETQWPCLVIPNSLQIGQGHSFSTPSSGMATLWDQNGAHQSFGSQHCGKKTQDTTGVRQWHHLAVSQNEVIDPIYMCRVSISGWAGWEAVVLSSGTAPLRLRNIYRGEYLYKFTKYKDFLRAVLYLVLPANLWSTEMWIVSVK